VEYAIEAIKLGSTAIGIRTPEGVVMAVEKRITSVHKSLTVMYNSRLKRIALQLNNLHHNYLTRIIYISPHPRPSMVSLNFFFCIKLRSINCIYLMVCSFQSNLMKYQVVKMKFERTRSMKKLLM